MTKKNKHPHAEKQPDSHPAPDAAAVPEREKELAPDAPVEESSAPSAEEQLKDRLLRLQADFDNYRKRIDREKQDWAAFAVERLASELLPVLDSFERGLDTAEKNKTDEAVVSGFRLIQTQLLGALEKSGVTPIEADGKEFDPHMHEAVSQLPSEDVPEGHILAVTRRGYKVGSKLLRPSQVVISAGPATP